MKSILIILTIFLFSCKKNYVCECNVTRQTTATHAIFADSKYTTVTNIDKVSKKYAKENCKNKVVNTNYDNTVSQLVIESHECSLK